MCLFEYAVISADYKIGEDGRPIHPAVAKGLFKKPWWQDSPGYHAAVALVDDVKKGLPCALWMVARMQDQEIYDFNKKISSHGAALMLSEAARSKFPPAIVQTVYKDYYPWFYGNPGKRLPPESEKQLMWSLEEAAEAGSIDALYELGSLRRLGLVEGNREQVFRLMKMAASKGSPDALVILAQAYLEAGVADIAAVYVILAKHCAIFYTNIFERPLEWGRIDSLYKSCREALDAVNFAKSSGLAADIMMGSFNFPSLLDKFITESDEFFSYKVFHQGKVRIDPNALP